METTKESDLYNPETLTGIKPGYYGLTDTSQVEKPDESFADQVITKQAEIDATE
jgi:hypothetical protein